MKIRIGSNKITAGEIALITDGRLCGDTTLAVEYICTDSREADKDTLFVAIKGENTDGHKYFASAADAGCRAFISEYDDIIPEGCSGIICESGEKALLKLARTMHTHQRCINIGITGSVGKTTTKEFVASVLSEKYDVHKSSGNYNSLIGMPMSMIETPNGTQFSVFEMAMGGLGEITQMSCAALPDTAIITNIGSSHLEALKTRENILKAKLEITDGLTENGVLILNGDDKYLTLPDITDKKTLFIAIHNKNADIYAENIRYGQDSTVFDVVADGDKYSDVTIPTIGEHNVYAALFAFAVGLRYSVDKESIYKGLAAYKGVGLRQNIYNVRGVTVIEDCYNASPESMKAAIKVLHSINKTGKTIAVLGDMRELGENSEFMHKEIGEIVAESGTDLLYTIGKSAVHIAEGARNKGMKSRGIVVNLDEEAYEATAREVARAASDGDIVLIKASRAIRAERVSERLKVLLESKK